MSRADLQVAPAELLYAPSTAQVPRPTREPVAVVVAHGMGQQVRFETLAAMATGLALVGGAPPPACARLVEIDGERLNRVEMRVPTCDGPREVHVYETYWASLTEGRVTLRDVTRFLFVAGWNGIRNRTGVFRRWLFGQYHEFTAPVRTLVYMLVGLAVVLALVAMNSAIALVAATWLVMPEARWPGEGLVGDLSTIFNAVLAASGLVGAVLWIARGARARPRRPNRYAVRVLLGLLSLIFFCLLMTVTIAAGVAVPALFALHQFVEPRRQLFREALGPVIVDALNAAVEFGVAVGLAFVGLVAVGIITARLFRARRREQQAPELRPYPLLSPLVLGMLAVLGAGIALELVFFAMTGWRLLPAAAGLQPPLRTLAWLLLIGLSRVARTALVQYVGDVAVYVQPYVLDRFSDLREEIKETVRKKVAAVYRATTPDGTFKYAKVALVGHSLGSVVLYDALNRLISDDELARATGAGGRTSLDTADRTALLLTFGSPLDKTAFVFESERQAAPTRAALAATARPLVEDPRARQFDWVNLYSPWDLISGRLDYYDPPGSAVGGFKPVDNVVDTEASTLLLAHVEYWDSTRLYDMVLARIS